MVENEWLENDIDSFKFLLVYLDPFSLPDVPNKDNSRIIIYIYKAYIRHILHGDYVVLWSQLCLFFFCFVVFPVTSGNRIRKEAILRVSTHY